MTKERATRLRTERSPQKDFVWTLFSRMIGDLREMGYVKGEATRYVKSGDVLSSRWLLSDGKTRISASFVEYYSDETLLNADKILKGSDKYRVYEAVRLLGLDPKYIPIPSPTMKIGTDLSQMIGRVFIRQTEEVSLLEDLFFNSARDGSKLRNEGWCIFKVAESGQTKIKIITDSTAVGPRYLDEPGAWSVPNRKLNDLNREIPRAQLLEARLIPRNSQEKDTLTLWNSLLRLPSR